MRRLLSEQGRKQELGYTRLLSDDFSNWMLTNLKMLVFSVEVLLMDHIRFFNFIFTGEANIQMDLNTLSMVEGKIIRLAEQTKSLFTGLVLSCKG